MGYYLKGLCDIILMIFFEIEVVLPFSVAFMCVDRLIMKIVLYILKHWVIKPAGHAFQKIPRKTKP